MNIFIFTLLLVCFITEIYIPREYDKLSVSELSNVRNKEYDYVYKAFESHHYSMMKPFVSHDPSFIPISYEMKQGIQWNKKPICSSDTFVFLLFFVNRADVERRQIIREYIHQGMVVRKRRIHYAFVVVVSSKEEMNEINKENEKTSDILVSVHKDSYANVTLTILDAFMWVRDYCKTTQFVGRVDGDVWIQLGNLIEYLNRVPKTKFYGGFSTVNYNRNEGMSYLGVKIVPSDYPPHKWVFNVGGAILYSRDVIPYINIGTKYMDLIIPVSEDVLIGEILARAGVHPYMPQHGFQFYIQFYVPGMYVPRNIIFVHNIKDMREFKLIYQRNKNTYLQCYK